MTLFWNPEFQKNLDRAQLKLKALSVLVLFENSPDSINDIKINTNIV